ncbi:MlaA family lipoprotein [Hirschia baltica]|uniref:VacJ family lipoprotein n=1 Tax=Hirschia baltica (strain ATCC 49814 / DSM 5838 / IFAM 1418) TaxID=582402 RepID=C6XMC9_HIRBI|nr:VacJ family lipoprotein [Hirschia baltica]ACT58072.1 VacJ family lipoprotein [Hirschia baltica ATCC 49814]
MNKYVCVSALAFIGITGCASADGNLSSDANDPFEGFNRKMFEVNNTLDKAILEPAAKGYRAITTEDIREGVSNALSNLREPVTFANEILQGDLVAAGETAGRFAMNSTLGVAGFVDVTGSFGVKRTKEDFGQTLGKWGVSGGPYLVLPVLGSTNPRDLFGKGVDSALQPLNYAQFEGDSEFRIAKSVIGTVSAREAFIETIDELKEQQADPYTAVRRIYDQTRDAAIRNGQENPNAYEDLPSYDEY